MRGSADFGKVNFCNPFSIITFFLLRCTMSLQSITCLKVPLKRSMSKWSDWIICNEALTGASTILRPIEGSNSADLGIEIGEKNRNTLAIDKYCLQQWAPGLLSMLDLEPIWKCEEMDENDAVLQTM